MNDQRPQTDAEPPKKRIWQDLKDAGLYKIAQVAFLIFLIYLAIVLFARSEIESWGQFGDSFGALTSLFNALAFAALVATVVLQSRELKESREQLRRQADAQQEQVRAQEAWANAAARQLELTKQLEAIRIRPFLKLEWFQLDGKPRYHMLRVRNVGLGVAVLRCIELRARDQDFGTVSSSDQKHARAQWERCLRIASGIGESERDVATLRQLNDLNRALAPNEAQELLLARLPGSDEMVLEYVDAMKKHLQVVIYFRGADGRELSTANQFQNFEA